MQNDQQKTQNTKSPEDSFSWLQDSPESEAVRLLALKKKKRNKILFSILLLLVSAAFAGWGIYSIGQNGKTVSVPRQSAREIERLQQLEEMLVFAKIHEMRPEMVVRKLEDFLLDFKTAETDAEQEKYEELLYVFKCAEEDYYTVLRDEKALQYYLSLQQLSADTEADASNAVPSGTAEEFVPDENELYLTDQENEQKAEIQRKQQNALNLKELENKMRPEREKLLAVITGFCMEKNYGAARSEILAFRQMMAPYVDDSDPAMSLFGQKQDQWAGDLLTAVRDVEQLELVLISSGETLSGVPLVIRGTACTVKSLIQGELTAVSVSDPEKVFNISVSNLSASELAMLVRRAAEKLHVTGNLLYFPLFRGDFFHCAMYDAGEESKKKAKEIIGYYFEMQWFTGNLPVERRALYDKYEKLPEFQDFLKKLQERAEAQKMNQDQ